MKYPLCHFLKTSLTHAGLSVAVTGMQEQKTQHCRVALIDNRYL